MPILDKKDILHKGSLMTYRDFSQPGGPETSLGYLNDLTDQGVFEPTFGRIDVSSRHATEHNKLLDIVMLQGLDGNCEIGQTGQFRVGVLHGKKIVKTFGGKVVSSDLVHLTKTTFEFTRNGRKFLARHPRNSDVITFERIS